MNRQLTVAVMALFACCVGAVSIAAVLPVGGPLA